MPVAVAFTLDTIDSMENVILNHDSSKHMQKNTQALGKLTTKVFLGKILTTFMQNTLDKKVARLTSMPAASKLNGKKWY